MTLEEYIKEQLKKYLGIKSPSEDAIKEGEKWVEGFKKAFKENEKEEK